MPKPKHVRRDSRISPTVRVLEPNAAGIDIGATEVFVAVPSDRDPQPVRSFATFTDALNSLVDWLHACGVESVAMESTSVFWIPLFQILEDRGFRVCFFNARHVKNVPGRKTDVSDCQWLQYLHSVGLLRASHRPPQDICAVRSICRHRESLVQMATVHIQHMQKALDQMNLQLHHVISDITGATGLAIVDAILAGSATETNWPRCATEESRQARKQSHALWWETTVPSICLLSGSLWKRIGDTNSGSQTAT